MKREQPDLLEPSLIETIIERRQIDYNFDTQILSLLHNLYVSAQQKFIQKTGTTKVKILAPAFFIHFIEIAMANKFNSHNPPLTPSVSHGFVTYRDVNIEPGYEMALVIFHEDTLMQKDPDEFCIKIPLVNFLAKK